MDGFELILFVYISYLVVDGLLCFLKIIFIFAEFGFSITINGIIRFFRAMYLQFTNRDGPDRKVLDYYIPGGILFIYNPVNYETLYGKMGSLKLFSRVILRPALLIDYFGCGVAIMCAIDKGDGCQFTKEDFHNAVIISILKLGYGANYYKNTSILRKLPIVANLIQVLEYNYLLIIETISRQRDIYGGTTFPKISRLWITYVMIYLCFMKLFG